MNTFFLNWLRGFAYFADGVIIIISFGLIEPAFGLRMDSVYLEKLGK